MRIKYTFEGRDRTLQDVAQNPPDITIPIEVYGQRQDISLELQWVGGGSSTDENKWTKGVVTFDIVGFTLTDNWEED